MFRSAWMSCIAIAAASTAYAQQQLTDDELKSTVVGKRIVWGSASTGVTSVYNADGTYKAFNNSSGRTDEGKYQVAGGRVCVDFTNNVSRCDRIFRDGEGIYLLNGQGTKFRGTIRPNTP